MDSGGGKFGFAEYTLSVGLGVGRNIKGFPKENEGFQVQTLAGENSESQKIHLVWDSVWERKCKDFHRKMKEFKGGF